MSSFDECTVEPFGHTVLGGRVRGRGFENDALFIQVGLEITRDEFLCVVDTEDFDVSFLLVKKELMVVL